MSAASRRTIPRPRPRAAWLAALIALAAAGACAEDAPALDDADEGPGGYDGAPSTSTDDPWAGSGGTIDGEGGAGGAVGAGGAGTSPGGAGGAATTTTTTTTTTGAGGAAPACGVTEHLCGGVCVGNTPASGCFGSKACQPCPAPANGSATCSGAGTCDIVCNGGYAKSGAQCVCAKECCSDADCGGEACQNGKCAPPPPSCDGAACMLDCLGYGCFGVCVGDVCLCTC